MNLLPEWLPRRVLIAWKRVDCRSKKNNKSVTPVGDVNILVENIPDDASELVSLDDTIPVSDSIPEGTSDSMKTTVVTTLPVPSTTNTRPYFYAWELTNPTPQINEAADKSSASGGYQMPSSEMHDRFPAYEYEVSISFCIYMNIL